jgi:hypothetical protein
MFPCVVLGGFSRFGLLRGTRNFFYTREYHWIMVLSFESVVDNQLIHLGIEVYKLIVDYGLKTEYHNPMVFPSVKEIARLVNALSFVPEEQVAEAFQQIHRYSATTLAHPRIGIKMTNFLEDIRTRWLTRIPDWNVYVLEQGQQRTNNDAESFNMSWNQSVSSRNTLWQYVHKLQLSQQAQETRYAQHLSVSLFLAYKSESSVTKRRLLSESKRTLWQSATTLCYNTAKLCQLTCFVISSLDMLSYFFHTLFCAYSFDFRVKEDR